MEVIIFCITFGIMILFIMFSLGIVIGTEHERIFKRQHSLDNCNNVLLNDDMGSNRNSTSNSKRLLSVRQNDRQNLGEGCYEKGKITIGCTKSAFEMIKMEFKKSLSQIEKDALDEGIRLCDEKIGE